MKNQPEITFIICTYNRAEYLDDALNTIFLHDFSGPNFELLIVDNNSSDETPEIVRKYQQQFNKDGKPIRYIKEPNQGLSHARNRGIREASGEYIVFLDDDIKATKSLIPAWISFFTEHPKAIAAGGKIHVHFDAPRPDWMSHFLLPLLGHHDLGDTPKKYPSNKYPFGGNMGFQKSIFDKIGLFDTELGRKGESLNAGEEKELFRRIRENSEEIHYLPDALLYHRVDESRLTIDYIKKQAIGLGLSMNRRMKNAPASASIKNWLSEIGKLLVSVPLGLFYLLKFQASKAKLLFLFRFWIWKGYRKPGDY